MSKVICMASAKGGSGKTVLTATFASLLSALKKKVLIIDTDASTNGLSLLYLKEVMIQGEHAIADGRKPKGIYELNEVFQKPELVLLSNNVSLIPATYGFQNTELSPLENFIHSLKSTLKIFQEEYDFIFLDAQAGSDQFAHIAMRRDISNEVVIVSEYDPLSAAGVERLKAIFRDDLTYNRTWVLLNKLLPDFVQSFSDFLEVAKYLNPIPWDADVVKAYARRRLAIDMEYGNEFTLAIMQTLETLLWDDISSELETWKSERSVAIKTPIETQYKDIEQRLDHLISRKFEFDVRNNKMRIRQRVLYIGIALSISLAGLLFIVLKLDKETLFSKEISVKWLVFGVGILAFFGAVSAYIDKYSHFKKEAGDYKERFRLQREIDMLEERLKKLEILKGAEIETLLKSKPFKF